MQHSYRTLRTSHTLFQPKKEEKNPSGKQQKAAQPKTEAGRIAAGLKQ